MVYEKTFPLCPYLGKGTTNCSHKGYPKKCIFVKCPEKCDMYQEWLILKELDESSRKYDSSYIEMRVGLNVTDSDND